MVRVIFPMSLVHTTTMYGSTNGRKSYGVKMWPSSTTVHKILKKSGRQTEVSAVRQYRWKYADSAMCLSLKLVMLWVIEPADPGGRAVYGVGLRPNVSWDCGFASLRGYGCLTLLSIVCYQVEVSATGRSLVQRSPTNCMCVTECYQIQQ